MIESPRPYRPRRILFAWFLLVVSGFVLIVLSNIPLLRYGEYVRAHDYRTYLAAADAAMKRSDLASALDNLERAFALAPRNLSLPYKVAGDVYYSFRKWDLAAMSYQKAISLGDRDVGSRQNAAWCLVQLKRYQEGIDVAAKALAEGFRYPGLVRSLAEAYEGLGDDAKAAEYYEQACKETPGDPYILERFRQVRLRQGNAEAADALRKRIEEVQSTQNAEFGGQGR